MGFDPKDLAAELGITPEAAEVALDNAERRSRERSKFEPLTGDDALKYIATHVEVNYGGRAEVLGS